MRIVSFFLRILLLFGVLGAERAIGIPVLFFLLTLLWWRRYQGVLRFVWLIVASLFLMALFSLSWVIAVGLIGIAILWTQHAQRLLPSFTIRLLLVAILCSVGTVLLSPGTTALSVVFLYILIAVVLTLFLVKRQRLQPLGYRRFN